MRDLENIRDYHISRMEKAKKKNLSPDYIKRAASILSCVIGDRIYDDLKKEPASGNVIMFPLERSVDNERNTP